MSNLATYLPRYQVARIAARGSLPAGYTAENGYAAALFVDITGFTDLTERMAARGASGAEVLSSALNEYFGRLTDIITEAGGDIVFFAGDAALAIWPAAHNDLRNVTLAACSAGMRICSELYGFTPVEGVSLQQRASVGAGEVDFCEVGGVEGRWLPIVSGAAIEQAVAGSGVVERGMTALSEQAAALCGEGVDTVPLGSGFARALSLTAAQQPIVASTALTTDVESLLALYVPDAVVQRLRAGHAEWLAEFREVTIAFIGLEVTREEAGGSALHGAVAEMQRILARSDGSVFQLVVDDKGTTLIAAFGLPPLAQKNAATRAVNAATVVAAELLREGVRTSIGIATGRAFCGPYGAAYRQQYTVVGPVINLAARLMQAAPGIILCDSETRHRAEQQFRFGPARELNVKGRAAAVAVAQPQGKAESDTHMEGVLVGREHERAELDGALSAVREGLGGTVALVGEAGIGKSRLLHDVSERARSSGVRVLTGAADAVERTTAYFAFRPILRELLESDRFSSQDALTSYFAEAERLRAWVPVLSAIHPIGLAENDITRAMPNEARAEALRALVVHMLRSIAHVSPLCVIIDDLHWLDSSSLDLCEELARSLPNALLIIGSRPLDKSASPALRRLVDGSSTVRLQLKPLPAAAVTAIAARKLGATSLPPAVVRLMMTRTEGHPFYAEELALALREAGLLVRKDDTIELTCSEQELLAADLPSSIQEVITSRIDRLQPTEQLALKTASVVGRVFAYQLLSDVYPLQQDRPQLRTAVVHLEQAELTVLERPDPELAYLFKHVITQEVTYAALPFAQRRQLHRSIAEWYERSVADLSSLHALLAHHWDHAGDAARAVKYLDLAGEAAVRSFANREAIMFLSRAEALAEKNAGLVDAARRAHWQRLLGDAHVKLSQYDRARAHMVAALRLLEAPLPKGNAGLSLALLKEIARQRAHRRKEGKYLGRAQGSERVRAQEIAAAYKRLGEVAWFNDQKLELMHATFACLNYAEEADATAEIINGYGSIAIVSGFANLHGIARSYVQRCIALGARSGNPSHQARSDLLVAVYALPLGDWQRAAEFAERGSELFARIGDRFRWECLRALRGYQHLCLGELAAAQRCWTEVLASAQEGALQSRVFAQCGRLATVLQGRQAYDDGQLAAIEELIAQQPQIGDRVYCHGVLAAAYARSRQLEAAQAHADAALALMGRTPPSTYYTLWGVAGVAEACVRLAVPGSSGETRKKTQRALGLLKSFARMIPIARPLAGLWQGAYDEQRGAARSALKHWQKALQGAQQLGMPVETALLERALAHQSAAHIFDS